jgi:hypothetical protein
MIKWGALPTYIFKLTQINITKIIGTKFVYFKEKY